MAFYRFINGMLKPEQVDSPDLQPEDYVAQREREKLMEEGVIGILRSTTKPGKMNRGYAGQEAWKRLLPEDYSY